jgi:diacylglycerol kinase family enzyme
VTALSERLDWRQLATDDDPETVWVAAGGDGTVNAVAAACAGSERAMAVLPVGTLNHFARDLGMPLELEPAIAVVANAAFRCVDVAEVNGVVFVNNSSLGMYPEIVLDRDRMRKGGGGKWWAMVRASARAFWRFRRLEVEFEAEGKIRRCKTALLFVGNNRYEKEGGRMGQRKRLDEGVLAVALIVDATRGGMLKVFAAAVMGRGKDVGELEEFVVPSFKVKARGRKRLRVAFDGEVKRMAGPLEYKVRPRALRIIAPALAQDGVAG